jgi:hypothetical protein
VTGAVPGRTALVAQPALGQRPLPAIPAADSGWIPAPTGQCTACAVGSEWNGRKPAARRACASILPITAPLTALRPVDGVRAEVRAARYGLRAK